MRRRGGWNEGRKILGSLETCLGDIAQEKTYDTQEKIEMSRTKNNLVKENTTGFQQS